MKNKFTISLLLTASAVPTLSCSDTTKPKLSTLTVTNKKQEKEKFHGPSVITTALLAPNIIQILSVPAISAIKNPNSTITKITAAVTATIAVNMVVLSQVYRYSRDRLDWGKQ